MDPFRSSRPSSKGRPGARAIATGALVQILLVFGLLYLPGLDQAPAPLPQAIPIDVLFEDRPPAAEVPPEPVAPSDPVAASEPAPAAEDLAPLLPAIDVPLIELGEGRRQAQRIDRLRRAFRRRFCLGLDAEREAECPETLEDLASVDLDGERYLLNRDLGAVLGPQYAEMTLTEAILLSGYHEPGPLYAMPDPNSPHPSIIGDLAQRILGPLPLPPGDIIPVPLFN